MVGQLCWSCTRASGNSRASERYCTRVDICIHHKFVRPSALSARHLLDSFHPCPHHRIQVAQPTGATAGDLASITIT